MAALMAVARFPKRHPHLEDVPLFVEPPHGPVAWTGVAGHIFLVGLCHPSRLPRLRTPYPRLQRA